MFSSTGRMCCPEISVRPLQFRSVTAAAASSSIPDYAFLDRTCRMFSLTEHGQVDAIWQHRDVPHIHKVSRLHPENPLHSSTIGHCVTWWLGVTGSSE